MRGTKPSSTSCATFCESVTPSYRRTATYIALAYLLHKGRADQPRLELMNGANCEGLGYLEQLPRTPSRRSSRNTPPTRLSEYRRISLRTEAVDGRTHHGQKSEVRFRGGLLQRRWPAGAGLQARHRRRGHLREGVGTLRRRGHAAADGGRGMHPQQGDYRRAPQAG